MKKVIKKVAHGLPVIGTVIDENQNLKADKGVLQLEKGQLEADVRTMAEIADSARNFLSRRFISGEGIEIGAAHFPVKIPSGATVKYVDVQTNDELRKGWPAEYAAAELVEVDVIDDGEKLGKFKDASLDFIIANHFLEHCRDPIGTVLNLYKKLRTDGVLYMAMPDKRYTFDNVRALTTYDHLLEEHKDTGGEQFRHEHTVEYAMAKLEKPRNDKAVAARVKEILESDYRIHYHVWTSREMAEMFVRLSADFNIDLEIEAQLKNHHEVIFVLRKEPVIRPIDYTPTM